MRERYPPLGMPATVMPDLLAALFLFRALRHESPAGWLFVPCLVWLLFATCLNGHVSAAGGTGFWHPGFPPRNYVAKLAFIFYLCLQR